MKSVLSTHASPRWSRATAPLTGGLALVFLALAGCNCGPTRQSCVLTTDCPSGQVCSANACYPGSYSPDAGPTATGGGGGTGTGGTTGGGAGTGQGGGGGPTLTPCVGLQCQQNTCEATHTGCAVSACQGGARTSISGVVREPAGQLPLYNVLVYVPNSTVQPFAPRGVCEACGASVSGSPLAIALTDDQGRFTLNDVPSGADVPLVIQIGRWRRQVKIPAVGACVNTAITDANLTRLPRNKTEGDLPLMAIATGGSDAFECLLLKMGIAAGEFTKPTGTGRVHYYTENGLDLATPAPAGSTLTTTAATLDKYDVVFLPCEGHEARKSATRLGNVVSYVNGGGRLFLTHFGYVWTAFAPAPFPSTAAWAPDPNFINAPPDPVDVTINRSFAKGQAFANWLEHVGAATGGVLSVAQSRDDVGTAATGTTAWMHGDNSGNTPGTTYNWTPHLTFTMPFNPPNQPDGSPGQTCGRVVFSDFHVTTDAVSSVQPYFPQACVGGAYTAQEKALVFMVFDLSSCVQDDSKPPTACKAGGEACSSASDCCGGVRCSNAAGQVCAGGACTCDIGIN